LEEPYSSSRRAIPSSLRSGASSSTYCLYCCAFSVFSSVGGTRSLVSDFALVLFVPQTLSVFVHPRARRDREPRPRREQGVRARERERERRRKNALRPSNTRTAVEKSFTRRAARRASSMTVYAGYDIKRAVSVLLEFWRSDLGFPGELFFLAFPSDRTMSSGEDGVCR
jgi:hypothetical protein